MKHLRFLLFVSVLSLAFLAMAGWLAFSPSRAARAQVPTADPALAVISEATGMEASEVALSSACTFEKTYEVYLCPPTLPQTLPVPNPAHRTQALQMLGTSGLLLIPDSTNRRVMAFDPISGDLLDADFVPSDTTHLTTPIQAILSTRGTFLISDQIYDVVQEYDLDGNYLGIFAPAGGANNAILDNIRGIQLRENGNLLVTVGSGSNADAIAEFDTDGNYLGNFVGIGVGGLASPFDVEQRASDWLVAGINSDAIHRYDLTGAYIANFSGVDNFPEQMDEISNGNVLVANFSGTQEGLVEFQTDGTFVGVYDTVTTDGYRGVYELPNGNILTTTGTGVYEIDRAGNVIATKIDGVSARFIEFVNLAPSITLDKTVGTNPAVCANTDTVAVAPGGDVTYCYTITNTGVITLTRHDLVDSELGSILSDFPFTLLPGASAFLTQTATILTNTVNTATWTAYNPGPTDVVSATDTASVTMLTPEIQLNKTVGTDPGVCATSDHIGVTSATEVTYCFEIVNTGGITLTRHDLVDSELGSILLDFPFTLIPGASAFITQTVMITETTVNTATWTAYNPGPTDQVSATDTATVEFFPSCPAGYTPTILEIADFEVFPPVNWTITNNTTGCTDPGVPQWTNTNPDGRPNLTGGIGAFAIADSDACGPGSVMTTTMTTGALDFTGIAFPQLSFYMDYNDLSSNSDVANLDASNDGGDTWNTLMTWNEDARGPLYMSTALPGAGENDVHVRWDYLNATYDWWWQVDNVTIAGCLPPAPEIELTKTVGTDPGQCATTDAIAVAPGTDVTYCYTVTNTGPITVTTHDLVDDQLGTLLSGFSYPLAPGASTFFTTTTTINESTTNAATWTGTTFFGDSTDASDSATVTVDSSYEIFLPLIYGPAGTTQSQPSPVPQTWVPWLALTPFALFLRRKK